MAFRQLFASIPVSDLERSRDFYERLLGRPADLIPNEVELAWQLTQTGWIYLLLDPDRAGTSLQTVLVDDLDRVIADLQARALEAGPVEVLYNKVRQSVIADPDGNRLKLGQVPA